MFLVFPGVSGPWPCSVERFFLRSTGVLYESINKPKLQTPWRIVCRGTKCHAEVTQLGSVRPHPQGTRLMQHECDANVEFATHSSIMQTGLKKNTVRFTIGIKPWPHGYAMLKSNE